MLDLILTKAPDIIQDLQIIENLAGSDHNMITWKVDIQKDIKNNWCIFDFKKGDYNAIRDELNIRTAEKKKLRTAEEGKFTLYQVYLYIWLYTR